MSNKLIKLSRVVSHALRHAPDEYNLVLDSKGWISIDALLKGLAYKNKKWAALGKADIYAMVDVGEKQRYEYNENYIRAIYGHSFEQQVEHQSIEPPDVLYHGTNEGAWFKIKVQGLKPMERQYVHLSPDIQTATQVAKRRTSIPVMIIINAKQAYIDGKKFYFGNDKVWLTELIEPQYLSQGA